MVVSNVWPVHGILARVKDHPEMIQVPVTQVPSTPTHWGHYHTITKLKLDGTRWTIRKPNQTLVLAQLNDFLQHTCRRWATMVLFNHLLNNNFMGTSGGASEDCSYTGSRKIAVTLTRCDRSLLWQKTTTMKINVLRTLEQLFLSSLLKPHLPWLSCIFLYEFEVINFNHNLLWL